MQAQQTPCTLQNPLLLHMHIGQTHREAGLAEVHRKAAMLVRQWQIKDACSASTGAVAAPRSLPRAEACVSSCEVLCWVTVWEVTTSGAYGKAPMR